MLQSIVMYDYRTKLVRDEGVSCYLVSREAETKRKAHLKSDLCQTTEAATAAAPSIGESFCVTMCAFFKDSPIRSAFISLERFSLSVEITMIG